MSCALTLSGLPSELQLCIIGHLSTRRLLRQVTRLSKHWHTLVCKIIRQRTLRLLSRPGVGLVVSHRLHVFSPHSPTLDSVRNQHTFTF
jgi:hypothetical protein